MSYKLKHKNLSELEDVTVSNVESLGLLSLEPRILLDAAGFITAAEVAVDAIIVEGAEFGVLAIFEGGKDVAGEPHDGPWLGNVAGEPHDGPWL